MFPTSARPYSSAGRRPSRLPPLSFSSPLSARSLFLVRKKARPRVETAAEQIPLQDFLIVSAIIFSLGVYGVLARRNAILILMSVELMLNAVALNFVAF